MVTMITGAEQYEIQAPTVFVDQLNSAFRNPEELASFLSAQVGEVSNEIEQQAEQLARMTVANMIGAKMQSDAGSVIHLLTEYNNLTGLTLDAQSVFKPENFPAFIKWAYSRIAVVSDQMTERSTKWHKSPTGVVVLRHTPKESQRLLMYAPAMEQIKTMVLSGLYNDSMLSLDVSESVNYWQNINQPEKINVNVNYMNDAGAVATATKTANNVFAVLYDRDSMGVNIFNEGVNTSPVNPKGRYYNTYHHFTRRYFNDETENVAVFLLD